MLTARKTLVCTPAPLFIYSTELMARRRLSYPTSAIRNATTSWKKERGTKMAGSITKRGKDSWRLRVSDGFNSDGSRRVITKTVKASSKTKAEKELAKLIADVETGKYVEAPKLTFKEFAEKWLQEHVRPNLSPKTLHGYEQLLKRIYPAIGHMKLERIKPMHILEFYNDLQSVGARRDGKRGKISGNTANHYHRLLSSMFKDAEEWQLIALSPVAKIQAPKIKKKTILHYTRDNIVVLLNALEREDIKYQAIVHIALFGGLRRGEVLGLDWDDIDFDHDSISVKRSCQYTPGRGIYLTDPKTESSTRDIRMPETTMTLVRRLRKHQSENRMKLGELWRGRDQVFTTDDGALMHPDSISKWMNKLNKKIGLPQVPFHGLRHTAATILIDEGTNIKSVSSRLGHRDATTTLNIYAHSLKSTDQEVANTLNTLINTGFKRGRERV